MSLENAKKHPSDLLRKTAKENDTDKINLVLNSQEIKIYAKKHPKDYLTILTELLITAVQDNNLLLSKFWMEECTEVNSKKIYRIIALYTAIEFNHETLMDYFLQPLEENFSFCMTIKNKKTALMVAVENNRLIFIQKLLKLGADITKTDVNGDTVFHYAARQKDSCILEYLLKLKNFDIAILQNKKNIYGHTPLDIAIRHNHKENVLLISPDYDFDKNYQLFERNFLTIVAQGIILDQMKERLEIEGRSLEFFPEDGACGAFFFLFEYYSSRGMTPYFYSTMKLMALWDRTKSSLEQPFSDDLPQKKYYKNLSELFEQWTNDIIFFRHAPKVQKITGFTFFDKQSQYSLVGFSDKKQTPKLDEYITFYTEQNIHLSHYITEKQTEQNTYASNYITEKQLEEFLQYVTRMPIGIYFEISGNDHLTGGHIQAKETIIYYDSNCLEELAPLKDYKSLLDVIIDYKYIFCEDYGEKLAAFFNIICFKKNYASIKINLEKFEVFKAEEMPTSKEDAENFQKKSPNQFTHLHIAVIMQSQSSLRKLLENGYCNVNAIDACGRTIFDIALTNNDLATIKLLAKFCETSLVIQNFNETLYHHNIKRNTLLAIISIFPKTWLDKKITDELLKYAISNNNLSFIKFFIEEKKIDPDQFYDGRDLLLNNAINNDSESIVSFLLDKKASVLKLDTNKCSALELSIKKHSGKYYQKIIESRPEPEVIDQAIKIAVRNGSLDIFKDLVNKGANVNIRSSSGGILFFELLRPLQLSTDFPELNQTREERINLFFPKIVFDLNSPKDRIILYIMLFNEINNSTFSKDFSEAFFKEVLTKCQNNKAILDHSNVAETQKTYGLLCECFYYNKVSKFKLLLEAGCNPDAITPKGNPLLVANLIWLQDPECTNDTKAYCYQMIELLLQHNADISLPNTEGQTGIMLLNKYKIEDPRLNEIYTNANIQESSLSYH